MEAGWNRRHKCGLWKDPSSNSGFAIYKLVGDLGHIIPNLPISLLPVRQLLSSPPR